MDPFKALQYSLLAVLVLFFAVSASADPGYYDYGVYYANGELGVYYYTHYDDYYQFYHYPDTVYDGVYGDIHFYGSSYYAPYGVYYTAWPYGYTVMDNYAYYPPYIVPDGYAYYPPLYDFYSYASPYFDYYAYYMPYSYRYYEYNGYAYDYQPSYGYYSHYGYPAYYSHYYPSDAYAGRFGDAGTVEVELGNIPEVYPQPQDKTSNFTRTFTPQTYDDGYPVEHADAPDTVTGSGSASIIVLTPQPDADSTSQDPAPVPAQASLQADSYTPSCQAISLQTQSVSLQEGEREEVTFYLRNTAFEDFIVDRFNAWTDSPYLAAYEGAFTGRIGANGSGHLTLTVDALPGAQDSQGHVTVYGHFENGRSCGFNEIKEDFSVFVSGQALSQGSCQDFTIEAPSRVDPAEKRFLLTLTNPLAEEALVEIQGNGVEVAPASIVLPANSYAERNIFFDLTDAVPEDVRITVTVPGCVIPQRIVYLNDNGTAAGLSPPVNGQGGVSLQSEVRELINGSYAVDLLLTNETEDKLSGRLEFADSRWFLQGANDLTINPNSEQNITLVISPDNLINKPTYVPINFVQANGEKLTTYAAFYPLEGAMPIAFFALTHSAVGFGLLVLFALILVYMYRKYDWAAVLGRKVKIVSPAKEAEPARVEAAPVEPEVFEFEEDFQGLEPGQKKLDDFDEDVYF